MMVMLQALYEDSKTRADKQNRLRQQEAADRKSRRMSNFRSLTPLQANNAAATTGTAPLTSTARKATGGGDGEGGSGGQGGVVA